MEHYFTNNENLKSELIKINYSYKDKKFIFYSDNGVFSKKKIDYGSKLLVETILEKEKNITNILDVGCGYGFIGIVLSKILNTNVTLIDINKRALELTKKNSLENKVNTQVLESNIYQNINDTYSLIVTNPPIRAGKEVVLNILKNAKDYLKEKGSLWFVIRKNQGALSIKKELDNIYKIEIIKKDKGFYIFQAKIY